MMKVERLIHEFFSKKKGFNILFAKHLIIDDFKIINWNLKFKTILIFLLKYIKNSASSAQINIVSNNIIKCHKSIFYLHPQNSNYNNKHLIEL